MQLNKLEFTKLVQECFENNYHRCAEALNVDTSTISRIINGNNNAGIKFLGNFASYCKEKGIDFNKYIFFN